MHCWCGILPSNSLKDHKLQILRVQVLLDLRIHTVVVDVVRSARLVNDELSIKVPKKRTHGTVNKFNGHHGRGYILTK